MSEACTWLYETDVQGTSLRLSVYLQEISTRWIPIIILFFDHIQVTWLSKEIVPSVRTHVVLLPVRFIELNLDPFGHERNFLPSADAWTTTAFIRGFPVDFPQSSEQSRFPQTVQTLQRKAKNLKATAEIKLKLMHNTSLHAVFAHKNIVPILTCKLPCIEVLTVQILKAR